MPSKRWKGVKREICRYLGTERLLQEGREGLDGRSDEYSIEVKHRAKLPEWIMTALDKTERLNEGDRTPIVSLHQKHTRIEDTLVITRLKYLKGAGE